MKTVSRVDTLTKAQEAQMASYAQKWIDIGLKTGDADWETFDKYMPICYEKAGLIYPSRIVRVSSPLVGGLAAAVAEGIWKKRRDAVDGAVDGAVRDAVGGAVRGAVRGAVGGAVRDAVGGAVRGAVDGAVRGAVRDAVGGAVRDAVGGAVRGAVGDAVRDAVGGAVGDAVGDAVDGAVRGAVGGAVRDAVGGAVRDAVDGAVRTAIKIAQEADVSISWHYWLGGQFWVGGYWWGAVSFVSFFFDICKLKLAKDIMERAEAYRKICESVNYIWPNREFIMVCDRPKEIHRNQEGRLHNPKGLAIRYGDGWGLYYIHGVKFTEEQFKKSQNTSITDVIAWEDIDQRSALLRERPIEELLENVPKTLIDHSDDCGGYNLWEIELKDIGKAKVLEYKGWSSDKSYIKFCPLDSVNALDTVAKLRSITTKELLEAIKS